MMTNALLWLLLNFLSIIILAFYSMSEMACVSFNKVRLHYYLNKQIKQAVWLNWLLQNPARLFGTTLIGVNVATFFGSEFAREFHASLGLDPDWAPLSQVFLVVILGELAPMFAARRYAENVAMLSAPLLYASARVMAPLLWTISWITRLCSFFLGGKESETSIFISQEELQKIIEEQDEERPSESESLAFNTASTNIFALSLKEARQIMDPLHKLTKIPSNATIAQVGNIMQRCQYDYIAVYHKDHRNIIGIIHARDLLKAGDAKRVRDYMRPPWFVTHNTNLLVVLQQLRKNSQELGIVLNAQGQAEGAIRLDDLLEEIFGTAFVAEPLQPIQLPFIEVTLPGDMKVGDFNARFHVTLSTEEELTLSELVTRSLGHHPEKGEEVLIDPFELIVEEAGLLEVTSLKVTTHL